MSRLHHSARGVGAVVGTLWDENTVILSLLRVGAMDHPVRITPIVAKAVVPLWSRSNTLWGWGWGSSRALGFLLVSLSCRSHSKIPSVAESPAKHPGSRDVACPEAQQPRSAAARQRGHLIDFLRGIEL